MPTKVVPQVPHIVFHIVFHIVQGSWHPCRLVLAPSPQPPGTTRHSPSAVGLPRRGISGSPATGPHSAQAARFTPPPTGARSTRWLREHTTNRHIVSCRRQRPIGHRSAAARRPLQPRPFSGEGSQGLVLTEPISLHRSERAMPAGVFRSTPAGVDLILF